MALQAAPQLQWSLDNTATGLLSISRGLLQAATSDNVQPIALLACERFGSTLPVCLTTRTKVEQAARQDTNQFISYFKASIGYRKGDSADILASTDSGLRFLCLASVLCSWDTNDVRAAILLDELLQASANDRQICPTPLQLKDLMVALKPKLLTAGFADNLFGWYSILGPDKGLQSRRMFVTPGTAEVRALIDGLRSCYRLGQVDQLVRITCSREFLPWTVATIKWLVGIPPAVHKNDGTTLLESDQSRVYILESANVQWFVVTLIEKIDALDQVIWEHTNDYRPFVPVSGLLEPKNWFKMQLDMLDLRPSLAIRILKIALLQIPECILFSLQLSRAVSSFKPDERSKILPCAFPNYKSRIRLLRHLVDTDLDEAEEVKFSDLQDEISQECRPPHGHCRRGPDPSFFYHTSRSSKCFKERMGQLIADILTLTLFSHAVDDGSMATLACNDLGYRGASHISNRNDLTITGSCGFMSEWFMVILSGWWLVLSGRLEFLSCDYDTVFTHALRLHGHKDHVLSEESGEQIVISSGNGQVIFPSVLMDHVPRQHGFLCLERFRGSLRKRDQIVTGFVSRTFASDVPLTRSSRPGKLNESYTPSVSTQPSSIHFWTDFKHSDFQYVSITLSRATRSSEGHEPKHDHRQQVRVWELVRGLACTVFSAPCPHQSTEAAGNIAHEFHCDESSAGTLVQIVDRQWPVLLLQHGDPALQLLQLGVVVPGRDNRGLQVLHSQGCIACCLDLAKELAIKVVIC